MRLLIFACGSCFSLPAPANLGQFVDTVKSMKRFKDAHLSSLIVSENVHDALMNADKYPTYPELQRVFSESDLDEFDTATIQSMTQGLLDKLPTLEDLEIVEVTSVGEFTPAIPESDPLNSELRRLVATGAWLESSPSYTVGICHSPSAGTISFAGEVEVLTSDEVADYPESSVAVDVSLRSAALPADLLWRLYSPIAGDDASWVDLPDAQSRAVLVSLVDRLTSELGLVRQYEAIYRDRFLADLREASRRGRANAVHRAVRSTVDALCEVNLTAVHRLRTSSGGGSSYRTRADKSHANRRDVDSDHHLHYWTVTDRGKIEFDRLAYPHDDFAIDD